MGEYADMMIDGTCCQGCGEFIGQAVGYPRFCSGCGGDPETQNAVQKIEHRKPFKCTKCNKRFSTKQGVQQHANDVH